MRKNMEPLSPLDVSGAFKKTENLNQLFKSNQLLNREPNTPLEFKNSQLGDFTPRGGQAAKGSIFKNALNR